MVGENNINVQNGRRLFCSDGLLSVDKVTGICCGNYGSRKWYLDLGLICIFSGVSKFLLYFKRCRG